ncbi:uncharacterized protein METZ01_LOCUS224865, partial [marine metagenome]
GSTGPARRASAETAKTPSRRGPATGPGCCPGITPSGSLRPFPHQHTCCGGI